MQWRQEEAGNVGIKWKMDGCCRICQLVGGTRPSLKRHYDDSCLMDMYGHHRK